MFHGRIAYDAKCCMQARGSNRTGYPTSSDDPADAGAVRARRYSKRFCPTIHHFFDLGGAGELIDVPVVFISNGLEVPDFGHQATWRISAVGTIPSSEVESP